MFGNIEPNIFDNSYHMREPEKNSYIFVPCKNMILLRQNSKMELELPQIQHLSEQKFILLKDIIFLFKINEDSLYWLKTSVKETDTLRFYQFGTIIFRLPKIFQFASITAQHLVRWYHSNL